MALKTLTPARLEKYILQQCRVLASKFGEDVTLIIDIIQAWEEYPHLSALAYYEAQYSIPVAKVILAWETMTRNVNMIKKKESQGVSIRPKEELCQSEQES